MAATVMIAFVVASVTLGDRAQLNVATGGRGVLSLLLIAAPLAAFLAVGRYGIRRAAGFVSTPAFVVGVLPYLLLTALLPVLGVIFNGYPERTLLSIADATTAFSFLVIGATLYDAPARTWGRVLAVAIVVQLLYATAQALFLAGAPGSELFGPLHDWDLSYAGAADFVQQRSSGLYLNPNELGVWAAVAVAVSLNLVAGRLRVVMVTAALTTLLLSQSRGSTVALVVALLVSGAMSASGGRLDRRSIRTALLLGTAALLALAVVISIAPPGLVGDRFGGLVDVLAEGPRAEQNLAGRLDYWSAVGALSSVYPWGTGGSPELLLGSAIDSTWFRVFAQGSAPYVAALVVLLFVAVSVRDFAYGRWLVLATVIMAVAGVTQTPLNYPIGYLFWVLLGGGLQASFVARATARGPGTWAARRANGRSKPVVPRPPRGARPAAAGDVNPRT